MNIANSNNNRKNENNNNNNDNNNNNINEGITLLLNEYTNEVMATGNGVGRELFTDDDFEVGLRFKHLLKAPKMWNDNVVGRILSNTGPL